MYMWKLDPVSKYVPTCIHPGQLNSYVNFQTFSISPEQVLVDLIIDQSKVKFAMITDLVYVLMNQKFAKNLFRSAHIYIQP